MLASITVGVWQNVALPREPQMYAASTRSAAGAAGAENAEAGFAATDASEVVRPTLASKSRGEEVNNQPHVSETYASQEFPTLAAWTARACSTPGSPVAWVVTRRIW
ncbi:MAG: hypothetical protein RKL24_01175 [Defluviicoccus sp.]|nr:hypothetical protein [Defluviicoccus sp.]